MEWYEGDIPKAISTAKQNRAILVVFIAGNDEDSHLMYASLQDSTVSGKLKDNCVALKLNSDSDSLKQFSQIYHVAAIPSTYFIGVKGVPLEVVCENVDVSRLLEKIDGVIRVHQQQINEASSAIPRESEEALPESSVTGSASVLLSSNHESVSMVTQDQPSSEERMKRAKLLASQLRAKRLAEEMEEEKRKEIERRNMGKQFQMLQRRNEELDPKLVAEEIARKKAEDRAIRQRVREQIAQDRAEIAARCNAQKAAEEIRNQEMVQAKPRTKQENASTEAAKERAQIAPRYNAQKAEEEKVNQEMVKAKLRAEQEDANAEAAKKRAEIAARSNAQKAEEEIRNQEMVQAKRRTEQENATPEAAKKRLQFRLPDGSSATQQFDADSSLQVVHDFVKEAVKPPFTPFTLSVAIPLRTFQKSDYSQLLRDLHVPPSAAILVHPVKSGTKQQGGSNRILRFLGLLLSPLL